MSAVNIQSSTTDLFNYVITEIKRSKYLEQDLSYLCESIAKLYDIDPSYPRKLLFMKGCDGRTIYDMMWDRNWFSKLDFLYLFDPLNYDSIGPIVSMIRDGDVYDHRIMLAIAKTGNLMALKTILDDINILDLLDIMYGDVDTYKFTLLQVAYPAISSESHKYSFELPWVIDRRNGRIIPTGEYNQYDKFVSSYVKLIKYLHKRCIEHSDGSALARFRQLLNTCQVCYMGDRPATDKPFMYYPNLEIATLIVDIYPWDQSHKYIDTVQDIDRILLEIYDIQKWDAINHAPCDDVKQWLKLRDRMHPVLTKGAK